MRKNTNIKKANQKVKKMVGFLLASPNKVGATAVKIVIDLIGNSSPVWGLILGGRR